MRFILPAFLTIFTTPAVADELSPKEFRSATWTLLDKPTAADADDFAKVIIGFASDTKDAEVRLGEEELKWVGKDKKYQLVLTAVYAAGNIQSQLHSGVIRNDRYAGLLTLFAAYREIQEKDKEFKIDAVEDLLKLHKEGKLAAHVVELDK